MTRAEDCNAKLASRFSHASCEDWLFITNLRVSSVREETMAESIA
jgi:hypothetical protein